MSDVAVLIPVLGRPERAKLVADSLRESQRMTRARIVFVCSPGDDDEIAACEAEGDETLIADWPAGPGDYARKINLGLASTREDFVFTGADDLRFHEGWADEAVFVALDRRVGVVGTNDLGNDLVLRGLHSTHSLVSRAYALERGTIDEPGAVFHPGYDHMFCDNELVETAQARGEWAFAAGAVVEHLHPFWHKGSDDATYKRGRSGRTADQRLFESRRRLWTNLRGEELPR